jgi:hypothetical protein
MQIGWRNDHYVLQSSVSSIETEVCRLDLTDEDARMFLRLKMGRELSHVVLGHLSWGNRRLYKFEFFHDRMERAADNDVITRDIVDRGFLSRFGIITR